jgi:5-methyltetrahydrofolate--homocysteine methyltransferase
MLQKEEILHNIAETIISGQVTLLRALITRAVQEGLSPVEIVQGGLMAGMMQIADKYRIRELYVPDVLIAARAMQGGMRFLRPHFKENRQKRKGKIIIGTVEGDIHDVGKSVVAVLLETAGYEVVDLGVDVSNESFVEAVQTHKPEVVAMSALLTSALPSMQEAVLAIKEICGDVKVLVGGAAVSKRFADKVGADGFSSDASGAVDWVQNTVSSLHA